MKGFRPLLAHNEAFDLRDLDWDAEWLASPKYDGYRAVTLPQGGRTRNLKPFANNDVDRFLSKLPKYLDGELVVGDPQLKGCFARTSSLVTTKGRAGLDGVRFFVFDCFAEPGLRFSERLEMLRQARLGRLLGVEVVEQQRVHSAKEALAYERRCIADGFEGAMLRRADGCYKFGRSTFAEGILLKRKVTLSAEAVILGVFSRKRNTNPQERDALGRAKRSKKKEGMVEVPEVGGFLCRDLKTKVEFECGTGTLTQAERRALYGKRLTGKIITYLSDPTTDKKPRFPRYHGFRSKVDL